MKNFWTLLGAALVFGLASHAASAAKPVRPISLSQVNAAPRGVPAPVAAAGLPALLVLGAVGWRRARARARTEAALPD